MSENTPLAPLETELEGSATGQPLSPAGETEKSVESYLVIADEIQKAPTREAAFKAMDKLVALGTLKKNEKGRYEPAEPNDDIAQKAIEFLLAALKRINQDTKTARQLAKAAPKDPKPETKAGQPTKNASKPEAATQEPAKPTPHPLAITIDGVTYPDRNSVSQAYNQLKGQDLPKAEKLKSDYRRQLDRLIKEIERDATYTAKKIAQTSKIKRKEDDSKGPLGVRDLALPFVERGVLLLNKSGEYSTPNTVSVADILAKAANARIVQLELANEIRFHKINGFQGRDKDALFAYQIRTGTDEVTGRPAVTVYHVTPIKGEATLKEGTYVLGINNPPSFVSEAVQQLEQRAQVRETRQFIANPKTDTKLGNNPKVKSAQENKADEAPKELTPIQRLSQAIQKDPSLKIINQVLTAFGQKKPENIAPGLSLEQLESILRKASEIEGDSEIKTPKSLSSFVEWNFAPEDLVDFAKKLTDLIQEAKQSKAA